MKTTKIFEGLFIVMLLFIFVSCVQDYTEESVIPEKPEDPIEEPIVDKDYDWKKECRAVSTCIIPAKSKINCSSGRYLFSPEYDAYLTFVDPTPYVSIDRDFLYIFEDVAKTKKDTVLNDAGFPVALNDGPITNELMVVINGNKYYSVTSSDETGQTKAAITRSLAGSNATLLDYAIVIDGGKNLKVISFLIFLQMVKFHMRPQ